MSMSTTDTKHSRKQKQKEPKSHPAQNGAERLKTVVRRLPPNLPEEIFWQSVQAWVTDDTITWKSYCPGKLRTKRVDKEGISSRAYIAFKNEEQVAAFSREYDGHLFRDKAGNESHAVVEFAPFQKVPTEKKKADARNNTIDQDEDYQSFLEMLKNTAKTESVSLETLIAASQPPPPPTTTPLLEALKAEKSAQKDKETILRNHAHYKDAAPSGALSKKEEAKKKAAAAAAQAAKQSEPQAPLSKKAKKAAAVQKPSSTQAQDGGPPGKSQPTVASAAPSSAKPSTPAPVAVHAPRHRLPKEPHGRPHPGKGDSSAPVLASTFTSTSASGPTPLPPVTTENAPPGTPGLAAAQGQGQRKNRPMIGLGRQFEAALNGAGVATAPGSGGDRKKRNKGGESGAGAGGTVTEGGGKHQRREERVSNHVPATVVSGILQRPEVGGGGVAPDVVIIQRPLSPRGTEGLGRHTEGTGGAGRGSVRRGRKGPRRAS
ncbi:Smg-4/UPF3 family-domain-containing protein [Butyriboletus roseoflavus]|nr:Smg-4/UPF3 family-domain-containing protein [Butyriboletus roseoflavus]